MPHEWLQILSAKKPLVTYMELRNMTCSEVYDILELQDSLDLYRDVAEYIQEQNKK
ncbi:hypothetical protein ACT414_19055 (plasmid) [Acinetobacter baumannii]|uniref:hypothetical protein n=1 Tax=Acinetobacter phage YMC13/03/R2096 TaxID=1560342 RepID=UPI00052AAC1A|nr:hypothetical protein ACQ36_gp145 [Acinetobacter phage YMC13/03/R2096]APD20270.2 putative tail assembly chaperone [Acinetobacter phage AM24]QVG63967.1 putative tail assembly chaperone protein [Acinetobacter phage Mithridates]QVG64145.1 putative tail assembly chaperone protein [Acinetobacter phage Herod]QVG64306.1 putative tail assembly chaperone [Acinetobacter phage Bestia]WNT46112.1 hypothetical protein [Acinetobacter phage P577]